MSISSRAARRARRSTAPRSTKWARCRCWCTATRSSRQSGVILTYLADRSGKFKPEGEDERLEALRWIIFDNQKVNGFLGPYRFLKNFAKPAGRSRGDGVPQGPHRRQPRHRRQAARRPAVHARASGRPSPTSRSCAYLYYPAEEFGFDIAGTHKNIAAWLDRIKALPGWKHPYELMPGHPLPGRWRRVGLTRGTAIIASLLDGTVRLRPAGSRCRRWRSPGDAASAVEPPMAAEARGAGRADRLEASSDDTGTQARSTRRASCAPCSEASKRVRHKVRA